MGRDLPKLPVENRFRERVKRERIRCGWSQADLSKLLQRKGLDQVYPTTVAKIESGERWVRIAEANALADLFGLSVDTLLGRSTNPSNDQTYALRALAELANRSAHQLWLISAELRERFADVEGIDFEGRATLQADEVRALAALNEANGALISIAQLSSDDPQPATYSRALFDAEETKQ